VRTSCWAIRASMMVSSHNSDEVARDGGGYKWEEEASVVLQGLWR
jgi:hypothetical protein